MELSPEERQKIYEEEKARMEAREKIEEEKQATPTETSVNMEPNLAGLLCYVFGWVTGIIFFIIEQKNNWIRFHAAQAIVTFGTLTVAGIILGWIPVIGPFFSAVIGITSFVLWIILMVKAYNGERFKVVWAGDVAESMVKGTIPDFKKPEAPAEKKETPPPPPDDLEKTVKKK